MPSLKWPLANSLTVAGRNAEAKKLMDEMRKSTDAESAFGLAWCHTARGDRDEALRWMEVSRERHHVWTPFVGVFCEFAPLHGDPRFVKLFATIGVPYVEPGYGQPEM